jgi:hypothetical protein
MHDAEASAQQYYAHNTPHMPQGGDTRVKDMWAHQRGMDYTRVADDGTESIVTEVNGISHHCQTRQQMGHGVSVSVPSCNIILICLQVETVPTPSEDLLPRNVSKQKVQQALAYMRGLNCLAAFVDGAVKVFGGSKVYDSLREIFDHCNISKDFLGLFLCIATNWKLDLAVHLDKKDHRLCVTIAGGQFEGGHMIFPQLDMAFR